MLTQNIILNISIQTENCYACTDDVDRFSMTEQALEDPKETKG